jgi:predicted permease
MPLVKHSGCPTGRDIAAASCGARKLIVEGSDKKQHRAVHEHYETNSIIIAILIGLVLRTTGIGLDPITSAALSLLGQATLPCVLLAMGLSLSTFELKGEIGVFGVISFL